jgi:hypothetical protein
MENFVKVHPKTIWALASIVILFLLEALEALDMLGGAWSFFFSTPPYQWLAERWPGMTYEVYWWLRLAISCGIFVVFVKILLTIRQQKKEESTYESLQNTITELQKELAIAKDKLVAIEDKRPSLKAEPFCTERTPQHDLHSGIHHFRDRVGSFVFLCVTNEPDNLNSQSLAHHIYARITYCDVQWNPLFRAVDGVWFDFPWDYDPRKIGFPRRKPESLSPHKSIYLGVALKYKWGRTPLHALCAESRGYPDWLNPDLTLPQETTYISVLIGCDGFQTTYCYILKNSDSQQGLELDPVDHVPFLSAK